MAALPGTSPARLIVAPPRTDASADAHPAVKAVRERFPNAVRRVTADAVGVTVIVVDPASVADILTFLHDDPAHSYDLLADVMGVDPGAGRPIQVWYQLWSMRHGLQLRVTVDVSPSALTVPTVTHVWKSADWLEREVYDMYGVRFEGHPDLRRILMPENYEEGFPLRKDFPLRGRFSRSEQTARALARDLEDVYSLEELEVARRAGSDLEDSAQSSAVALVSDGIEREDGLEGQKMLINMGPQHPATHGVLRLAVELDGEIV